MTNKEAIEALKKLKIGIEFMNSFISAEDKDKIDLEALDHAIKALEKDKCSSCKHYDKDYGETCLNPEGTCRVFEYDGYEEAENKNG